MFWKESAAGRETAHLIIHSEETLAISRNGLAVVEFAKMEDPSRRLASACYGFLATFSSWEESTV